MRSQCRVTFRLNLLRSWPERLVILFLASTFTHGAVRGASSGGPQVKLHPGDHIEQVLRQSLPGTQFNFSPGIYRMVSLIPRTGDSFVGEPGAILNGSERLSNFSRSGRFWSANVHVTPRREYGGVCIATRPECKYPEDLFWDDKPLQRVAEVEDIGVGKWYLDYPSHTVYIADNPAGHEVEIGESPYAIRGAAADVHIEGFTIEKYASEAGEGAVDGRGVSGQPGRDWVVQNNTVRWNHGIGVRLSDGMHVVRNKLSDNGQLGVGGGGTNVVVERNEIAQNNYAGYDYTWEAGGTKFAFTRNLVVRDNFVHDNDGPGLWTDLENENTLYEHNHTASNREAGILHEVSYHAVIRNNLIEKDGFSDLQKTDPWYGAGIIIAGSANVEVYDNTVIDCMNGIVGTQPQRELSREGRPYLLQNLNVHDNIIAQAQGAAAGVLLAGRSGYEVFDSRNNRFLHNQFHLADSAAKYFVWKGTRMTYGEWEAETHQ